MSRQQNLFSRQSFPAIVVYTTSYYFSVQKSNAEPTSTEDFRPGLEVRILRNMIYRYLAATLPQEAETATGGNTSILMYLFKHQDREVFQRDIEKHFGLARSTASRVLGLMEKKGLIERKVVERDARLRRILLTEKAFPVTEALRKNAARMEDVMLQGFSERDQQQLATYLNTMKSNLIASGNVGTGYDSLPSSRIADEPHDNGSATTAKDIDTSEANEEVQEEEGRSEK